MTATPESEITDLRPEACPRLGTGVIKFLVFLFFFLISHFSLLSPAPAREGAHLLKRFCRAAILLAVLLATLFSPAAAWAACSSPAGNAGNMVFNNNYHLLQYCNGGTWVSIGGPVANTTTGLVGWWKLDESSGPTATDSSGAGNDGTWTNAPTYTASGINGGALTFAAASSQYVSIPTTAPLIIAGSWTVSTWVKMTSLPTSGNFMALLGRTDASACTNYGLYVDNGHFNAGAGWVVDFNSASSCSTDRFTKFSATIIVGVWYHFAAVYDSVAQTETLYLNGASVASQSVSGFVPTSAGAGIAALGSDSAMGGFVNGTLDDSRVYNRALSATDIATLYASTGGASGDINTGLKGYWKFDEPSGNLAADSSVDGYNGTLNGASPPTHVTGKIVNGLQFNGTSNSYVSTGKALSTFMSATDGTFALWVYPTANAASNGACTQGSDEVFIEDSGSGGGGYFAIGKGTSNLCGVCSGTVHLNQIITTPTVLNQWTHLVLTHTGGNMYFYKNGSLVSSMLCDTMQDITNTVGMGNNYSNTTILNSAILDEVRVYNRALSPSDVLTLYNSTNTACAGPVGYAGDLLYNNASHVYQFCNGTTWRSMGKVPGAGGAGCTSPAGTEGTMIYNSASAVLQYCDGTNWRPAR